MAVLRRFGLRPRKALSQNFLVDPRQAVRIADAVGAGPSDCVLEVGAGLGALTLPLAERAGRVVAIERDTALTAALAWVLRRHGVLAPCASDAPGQQACEGEASRAGRTGRVWVIAADALRLPFDGLKRLAPVASAGDSGEAPSSGRCLVAGNLPYGITSPLLMWLVAETGWDRAVVMVQREVADRMTAAPGTEAYGSLTVAIATRCSVRRLFDVSRRCFYPQPEVDSTVLALEPLPDRPDPELSRALEAVLRAAFGQRRKTLRNALRSLSPDPGMVASLLEAAGVDGELRGEALSVEQFVRLARAWQVLGRRCRGGPGVL